MENGKVEAPRQEGTVGFGRAVLVGKNIPALNQEQSKREKAMEQEMKEIEAKEDERSIVDVWIWAFGAVSLSTACHPLVAFAHFASQEKKREEKKRKALLEAERRKAFKLHLEFWSRYRQHKSNVQALLCTQVCCCVAVVGLNDVLVLGARSFRETQKGGGIETDGEPMAKALGLTFND